MTEWLLILWLLTDNGDVRSMPIRFPTVEACEGLRSKEVMDPTVLMYTNCAPVEPLGEGRWRFKRPAPME